MKNILGVYLSFFAAIVLTGCASSGKVGKPLPEAQVYASEQAATTPSSEELSLVSIQSKYLIKDTTQVKVYLYVDAYRGKNSISVDDFVKIYNLNYVIYSDYGARDRLGYGNVKLSTANVSKAGNRIVISFDVKSPNKDYGVLLSEISQTGTLKKVLNDLTIRFKNKSTNELYGIYTSASSEPLQ
ncbi:MAG TPA: hypothetical protein VGN64_01495, partial [Dyadobacter sp.]|nr:hypothetical protein [Dyadobacter sp.]